MGELKKTSRNDANESGKSTNEKVEEVMEKLDKIAEQFPNWSLEPPNVFVKRKKKHG